MFFQVILNYLLLGAAMFPMYMRLDEHTFAHVIETTGELDADRLLDRAVAGDRFLRRAESIVGALSPNGGA